MLIRIDNADLVNELCAHYRRPGFDADFAGVVDVALPSAASMTAVPHRRRGSDDPA